MGKAEIVAYESEVDKLCAGWVAEVAKELKHCKDVIKKASEVLGKKIASVSVPENASEKELNAIPERIKQILKEDSAQIKDAADLQLNMKIDVKKKKLSYAGFALGGSVIDMNL
jgi:hypothetical protein